MSYFAFVEFIKCMFEEIILPYFIVQESVVPTEKSDEEGDVNKKVMSKYILYQNIG